MSVIDRFVVELALDPKKFSGPAKQAVEDLRTFEKQAGNTGNSIEGVGRKGADAFAGVRREALAMFAVFTAGKSLKAFASDATHANAQLSIMSRQLNMNPQTLSRMESAAKAAGGSFGEMGQAYAALQKAMTDPEQRAKIGIAFNKLGITGGIIDPKTGQIRTDLIDQINKAISSGKVSKPKAASILDEIGVFGQGAKNLAFMDREQFNDVWGRANRLPTPTAKELKDSERLLQHLSELRDEAQNLSKAFIGDLAPAIDEVVTKLMDWGEKNPGEAKKIAIVASAIGELAGSLHGLGSVLASLAGISILKRLFGGDTKALRAAIEELKSARAGLTAPEAAIPKAAPALSGMGVLSRLMSYGGAVIEGFRLNSAINADRKDVNDLARAAQKGSVTDSPMFGAMASAVAGIEGANYNQMGGSSNRFAGRYQMGADEIRETAQSLGESTPTQAAFLADPKMQERYFKAFTKQHEWYLLQNNEQFRGMNDAQKLSVLAYAHNQGAAGADKWLRTGVDGKDKFGTSGALYAQNTLNALGGYAANRSAQAEQDAAVKRLIDLQAALKDQMDQAPKSIGTGPSAQLAARAVPGGGGSGNATTNTTTVQTGDIVIHTQATDAKGIAKDTAHEFRQQLAALNLGGLQ